MVSDNLAFVFSLISSSKLNVQKLAHAVHRYHSFYNLIFAFADTPDETDPRKFTI